MLEIKCPYCGKRSQNEFSYGGDASLKRPQLEKEISGLNLQLNEEQENSRKLYELSNELGKKNEGTRKKGNKMVGT